MSLNMKALVVGALGVNCYILHEEGSKEAIAIDPGGSEETVWQHIQEDGLNLKAILNTHAHADHIGAIDFLREKTGAKLYIHEADAPMLLDARKNLSAFMGVPIVTRPADILLKGGEVLEIGGMKFTVLHTPGHSPGGVCYLMEDRVFSGDTLFAESVGRTDFPGSSTEDLLASVKEKLMTLPDELAVYCGHGPATTIGHERKCNPYINGFGFM